MAKDRITAIEVRGLRACANVKLQLDGLQVLIGENGAGKSTLIEGCAILRRAAERDFVANLLSAHGGMHGLLTRGASELGFVVWLQSDEIPLRYELVLQAQGNAVAVAREELDAGPSLSLGPEPWNVFSRSQSHFSFGSEDASAELGSGELVLATVEGPEQLRDVRRRMRQALQGIEVHLPFDSVPGWARDGQQATSPMRDSGVIQPTTRLARFGGNLPNAYHALRNDFGESHWRETLEYVRMGLGPSMETITNPADPGGGRIGLAVKLRQFDDAVPAYCLSDGMLSYLAMVALLRLGDTARLIAFDEPETHLHPELLLRTLGFFERLADDRPVILATHSDRLLDGLSDPAQAVTVCELNAAAHTVTRTLSPEALADWLERYRGVGDLRSAGYLRHALTETDAE